MLVLKNPESTAASIKCT